MAKIDERPLVSGVTDNIKLPTGEIGDTTINVGQIKNYTLGGVFGSANIQVNLSGGSLTLTQRDVASKTEIDVVDDNTLVDSGSFSVSTYKIAEYTLGRISTAGNLLVTQTVDGVEVYENAIGDRLVDVVSDETRFNIGLNATSGTNIKEYVKTSEFDNFTLTTSTLNEGEHQYFTLSCQKQIRLFNISTTQANSLIRVYSSESEMIADVSRPSTEFHSESSGLLFEFLSADILLTKKLSPEVDIYSPTRQIYISVKNNGETPITTEVVLDYLIIGD